MKTLRLLLLAMVGLGGTQLTAAPEGQPAYVPLKIIQTESPIFPQELIKIGWRNGDVRLALQVDHTGVLTDYVVTAYSHKAFADRVVTALKKWRFEPPLLHGTPCEATVDISVSFETEGPVIVDLDVSSAFDVRMFDMLKKAHAYRASRLRELDRIPVPREVVAPVYPKSLASGTKPMVVTVEFLIDEEGRVRLPAVSRATNEANLELAAAAVTAVTRWRFEPPTAKGKPVLVRAQQDFAFQPVTK